MQFLSLFSNSLLQMSPYEGWNLPPLYFTNLKISRMWANAQRDGRPAEHRWRPLFNAVEFGWRPLLDCCAVTLSRRDTCWNMMGCSKPANRSQPLVGLCSPYCEDIWRTYCCLSFSDCRYVPWLRRYSPTKLCNGAQMAFFCDFFLGPAFSESRTFQTCILNSH